MLTEKRLFQTRCVLELEAYTSQAKEPCNGGIHGTQKENFLCSSTIKLR
jgi:hypothetical protein